LVLVFHHSLADGYSLLHLITNAICCKEELKNAVPNYLKRTWFSLILYCAVFPFLATWESSRKIIQLAKKYSIRANLPLDKKCLKGSTGSNYSIAVTRSLPLSLIKDIKCHFNTSFAAVQCSVLSLALRDLQLKKDMEVPLVTPFLTVAPYPGHKLSQLRNHMYAAYKSILIKPTLSYRGINEEMNCFS